MSEEQNINQYLIAGLGNPGRQYRQNRHNAGFMVLDQLARRLGETFSRYEQRALVVKCRFKDSRLILVKPQTFMNESGAAISALYKFYKISLPNIMVVYDDVDLPFGSIRIRPAGGAGGQRGMSSVIERLGTNEYARLRIGLGRPAGRMDAAAYVLRDFSKEETIVLPQILDSACNAVLTFVQDGLEMAMNTFNGRDLG